jgi:hypothetical protein
MMGMGGRAGAVSNRDGMRCSSYIKAGGDLDKARLRRVFAVPQSLKPHASTACYRRKGEL